LRKKYARECRKWPARPADKGIFILGNFDARWATVAIMAKMRLLHTAVALHAREMKKCLRLLAAVANRTVDDKLVIDLCLLDAVPDVPDSQHCIV
jgi:hypothetical protein